MPKTVGSSCSGCGWVEASYLGLAWVPIETANAFGDHCHSRYDVEAFISANGGTWPGLPDFDVEEWLQNLSPETKKYSESSPWACLALPEAFPCYASRGNNGEAGSKNDPACAPLVRLSAPL